MVCGRCALVREVPCRFICGEQSCVRMVSAGQRSEKAALLLEIAGLFARIASAPAARQAFADSVEQWAAYLAGEVDLSKLHSAVISDAQSLASADEALDDVVVG
jgi:hypothetical protein